MFFERQNLVGKYSNFTITFPTIWRCAGDFLKFLLKFNIAAMDQLPFFVRTTAHKLRSEIIHILQRFHITHHLNIFKINFLFNFFFK